MIVSKGLLLRSASFRVALFAGVAAFAPDVSAAAAQGSVVTACDVLTAHPDDPDRLAAEVHSNDRDPVRAVPACQEALRAQPSNMRLIYQLGLAQDSARNFAESIRLYQRAADAGYVPAMFALGWAYANGEGVVRDDAQAIRWYRTAADRGHSAAQNTLGFMYENGRGVTRDFAQAAEWYRRASENGRSVATFNYARLLAAGRGVPQDRARAIELLRRAVRQDRQDAALHLALMAERGEAPQVTQGELIDLLALAETRSVEQQRATRSLERLISQGAGTQVAQARQRIAATMSIRAAEPLERQRQREAAYASLMGRGGSASPPQQAAPQSSSPVINPAVISWVLSSPPQLSGRMQRSTMLIFLDGQHVWMSEAARAMVREIERVARTSDTFGRIPVIEMFLPTSDGPKRLSFDDLNVWSRLNIIASELMVAGVDPAQIFVVAGNENWAVATNSRSEYGTARGPVIISVPPREASISQPSRPAPTVAASSPPSAQPAQPTSGPSASAAQANWLAALMDDPMKLAAASGGLAVLLGGFGYWLGMRRSRNVIGYTRSEPVVTVGSAPAPFHQSVIDASAKPSGISSVRREPSLDADKPVAVARPDQVAPANDAASSEDLQNKWFAEAEERRAQALRAAEQSKAEVRSAPDDSGNLSGENKNKKAKNESDYRDRQNEEIYSDAVTSGYRDAETIAAASAGYHQSEKIDAGAAENSDKSNLREVKGIADSPMRGVLVAAGFVVAILGALLVLNTGNIGSRIGIFERDPAYVYLDFLRETISQNCNNIRDNYNETRAMRFRSISREYTRAISEYDIKHRYIRDPQEAQRIQTESLRLFGQAYGRCM